MLQKNAIERDKNMTVVHIFESFQVLKLLNVRCRK